MDVTLEPMGDFLTSPLVTEDNSEVLFSRVLNISRMY